MMLKAIKDIFITEKDYAGRNIDVVIQRLAVQSGTTAFVWSYLREEKIYENTENGMRIYPHEVARKVA